VIQARQFKLMMVCPIAGLALLSGCRSSAPQTKGAGGPPAVPVSVAVATQQDVPVEIRAIGTVEASSVVQVKSQIAGQLLSVHFVEGREVEKGALLFNIDPRPYQEALKQAEAALQKDQAALAQAQANLGRDIAQEKNARADSDRYTSLEKQGIISRSQSEQYRTSADALHESVQADQAAIASARASLESSRASIDRAKLDLNYCEIRSPISGRVGNLLVHPGNLVSVNSADPLVIIHQITPIFISFGVPEDQLPMVRRRSGMGQLVVDASPQGEADKHIRGTLSVIDNTVDTNTGTIKLKATFANSERTLWPGQFVNVALTLDTLRQATLVPSEAVQSGQKGQFTFVVKPDQTVEARVVTLGPAVGHNLVVKSGIEPGETVVTDGQLRLFPGARIQAVSASKLDSPGQ
jgi:membrane fusion protein, multidrug efflux system